VQRIDRVLAAKPDYKILFYCQFLAEQAAYTQRVLLHQAHPESEYTLENQFPVKQPDGGTKLEDGVLVEHPLGQNSRMYRGDQETMYLTREDMEADPYRQAARDCAGSILWTGGWQGHRMLRHEELLKRADQTIKEIQKIDATLDPRLARGLPQPRPTPRNLAEPEVPNATKADTPSGDLAQPLSPPFSGQCLSYAPASVTLTGALTSKTFPGRPNYESIEKGDEPERTGC
jgi:hypothetical protein